MFEVRYNLILLSIFCQPDNPVPKSSVRHGVPKLLHISDACKFVHNNKNIEYL